MSASDDKTTGESPDKTPVCCACLSGSFNTIKKNEKSNFNDARCSINAFFLRREENVQKV